MTTNNTQKILVFQEKESAKSKVKWIKQYDCYKKLFNLEVFNINIYLPEIIDNSLEYLPSRIDSNIVIDYLKHPDLSQDLIKLSSKLKIPIISSGEKKNTEKKQYSPNICCSLEYFPKLGKYNKHFGMPELKIETKNNKIKCIKIIRGAPCGSTWKAAIKTINSPIKDAAIKFGLNIQYLCNAKFQFLNSNNTNSDKNNPIHTSAEIHKNAIIKAINENLSINKE